MSQTPPKLERLARRYKTRHWRAVGNWWQIFGAAVTVWVLTGCGSGVFETPADTREKLFTEWGDSTTRGRGDLVGVAMKALGLTSSAYENHGYDGQTTAQAVNGLDGANGFTGANFADSMAALAAWNKARAKANPPLPEYRIIVGLNLGINDRLHSFPISDSIANMTILATQAKAQGFEVLVVLPNKLCLDLGMAEYVDRLKALKLPVVDVFSMSLNLPDCIHPDQPGREAVARVIAEAVKKL